MTYTEEWRKMHTLWTEEQWSAKTSRVHCHGAKLNQTDGFQVTTTLCHTAQEGDLPITSSFQPWTNSTRTLLACGDRNSLLKSLCQYMCTAMSNCSRLRVCFYSKLQCLQQQWLHHLATAQQVLSPTCIPSTHALALPHIPLSLLSSYSPTS